LISSLFVVFPVKGMLFSFIMKIQLPEELTEVAVTRLKEQILKELRGNIVLIVFFGSRQIGKYTPQSDIDILIILREKTTTAVNKIFTIAHGVESSVLSYKVPFSLHIHDEDEYKKFKHMKSLFIREIKKTGRGTL